MDPDPTLLLPKAYMDGLRDAVTTAEPDAIAVIVLTGNPERGLALSVSSRETEKETIRLLAAALMDDLAQLVIDSEDERAE